MATMRAIAVDHRDSDGRLKIERPDSRDSIKIMLLRETNTDRLERQLKTRNRRNGWGPESVTSYMHIDDPDL